jgi:hypothetical protein
MAMSETKPHSHQNIMHPKPITKQDILPPERHIHPKINQDELNKGLLEAAKAGNNEEIESLLKSGADVKNARDNHGWTALSIAAFHGHIQACALLIEKEADVDSKDSARCTPLHWAAFNGHMHICQLLIHKGADPYATDASDEMPHNVAAIQGHYQTAQFLRSYQNANPKP